MQKLIAVPTTNAVLSAHFGHCETFRIFTTENNEVTKDEVVAPPPHEPGLLPKFLRELGVNSIIAGGMGSRAQDLFAQNNIEVLVGVGSDDPAVLVQKYLKDELKSGTNLCDH
jgi:ATP-binding protein involved in chromosome partitioning